MDFPFPVTEAVEGRARLLVPDVPRRKGPNAKGPWPFYNPTMVVNRDLSAIALGRWPSPLEAVLDGLAGTGAWGIRMALEAGVPAVTFNDRSPDARDLIRANVARNGLSAEVHASDLRTLLAERPFDFLDVDPFGPPTPFLGHALHAARPGAGLGVTATDTAPLCGTYPRACERRYAARPLRCDQGAEIGLRILVGYIERVAQAHGKAIRPLLAFRAEHFLRALIVVDDGFQEAPSRLGYVSRDDRGMFLPVDGGHEHALGPLWMSPLMDPAFVRSLVPSEWTRPETARFLAGLQGEADLPPFFVTTRDLGRRMRGSPPKLDAFVSVLRGMGYRAARTHFHATGVKTDAPPEDVLRGYRALRPNEPTAG